MHTIYVDPATFNRIADVDTSTILTLEQYIGQVQLKDGWNRTLFRYAVTSVPGEQAQEYSSSYFYSGNIGAKKYVTCLLHKK